MLVKKNKHSNGYNPSNAVRLVRGGSEYFGLLVHLIRTARQTIHLQYYIFDDDETGKIVAEELKKAAYRKVSVYLLVDGYASRFISHSLVESLQMAGIHFRFFEPLLRSKNYYFGRRMHHKVMVVDACKGMAGGINISNRYNDMPDSPAWLDFALYVEGRAAWELNLLCQQAWKGDLDGDVLAKNSMGDKRTPLYPGISSEVRIRRNDWVRRKNQISATYIEMLRTAQKDIILLSSYFLPGKIIRKQIRLARKRGVSIRVVAAGTTDVPIAKQAERWLYDWLLRLGVEVFEYRKNILHGKMAVCDDLWMTIGSYNINNISAYASIELNLDVKDPVLVKETRILLEQIISKDCKQITEDYQRQKKNVLIQLIRWISYEVIRSLIYLFTFYFKHKD